MDAMLHGSRFNRFEDGTVLKSARFETGRTDRRLFVRQSLFPKLGEVEKSYRVGILILRVADDSRRMDRPG